MADTEKDITLDLPPVVADLLRRLDDTTQSDDVIDNLRQTLIDAVDTPQLSRIIEGIEKTYLPEEA